MGVCTTVFDNLAIKNDGFGFLDFKRRALDIVREIRLEKGEIFSCDAGGCGISDIFQYRLIQCGE